MKNILMKLCLVILLLLIAPVAAFSAMDSYCSAPPYVTRNIAPNIMVVMDNSEDMLQPAYPEAEYTPNATWDNYIGYYKPQSCYEYSVGKFREVLNGGVAYTAADTCPSSAPFRGNLMNWATMSKYDVLQKVIVGGNATSKQGNAHTLVSISEEWPVGRHYSGCEFRVDNCNLTIKDYLYEGACTLLNATPSPIAMQAQPGFFAEEPGLHDLLADYVDIMTGEVQQAFASAYDYWDSISLISEAWAAVGCYDVQIGPLDGTLGDPFYLTLALPQNLNNKTAYWTFDTIPSWLTFLKYEKYNNKLNQGVAIFKGVPTAADTEFYFEGSVTSDGCSGSVPFDGTISIAPEPMKINHYNSSLPDGKVGEQYLFELNGQGGIPPLSWNLSGLPLGLTLYPFPNGSVIDYYIEGTPVTAGEYAVTLTLMDSSSNTISKDLTLTILPALEITTNSLPSNPVNYPYTATLAATGGTPPYTWSVPPGTLQTGLSLDPATGVISGTPTVASTQILTFSVVDSAGNTAQKELKLTIDSGAFASKIIASESPLPNAYKDTPYTYQVQVMEYLNPFLNQVWAISGQPAGMTIDSATGLITWLPTANVDTTYTGIVVTLDTDYLGIHYTDTQTFSITSLASLRSQIYSVKVELIEDPLTDLNGNDSWDEGESFTDLNGNGVWDGKSGVFHKFWDAVNPKARWGMTKFSDSGTEIATVASCIPVTTAASFFTSIQNATAASTSPLADGLYGAINYYGFESPYGNGFNGCTNSDPIDNIPCRKNFILMITSGANVSGTGFTAETPCSESEPLVRNACYGYENDLRADADGKQHVYTYIVNTMGDDATNNAILQDAAAAGGGADGSQYYEASSGSDIEEQLTRAIEDILAQAASGTAVSVLTTSSRGIGSMMQAYFLPIRQEAEREVRWTGYVQNLWIDPDDNLREDSNSDYRLKLTDDNILRLYFNEQTNEAKAALFTDGLLESCTDGTMSGQPTIKEFNQVSYTWEGGDSLASRPPSERNLFTAKKVIHGATATSLSGTTTFDLSLDASIKSALDADATYTSDNIIRYVRGECLESGVTGDSTCSSATDTNYRDRRIDGKVWKLGDVISSTPKVLAGTPNNTYHIDYGDITYYNFVSSSETDFKDTYGYSAANSSYSDRSSIAFVGANDGMLHAFRVGYLKDKEVTETGVLGLFKNFFDSDDSLNDKVGEEVWGYVPYNALPYLKYLANPNYCHIYYNDLSVRLVDASLGSLTTDDSANARTEQSWKTILVGGMRFGGACDGGLPSPPGTVSNVGYSAYYAIDVTDAENPQPLWEFSDPDMGYATGFPSVLRTGGPGINGHWYVAFGSGSTTLPKSATDIARSKDGYLYILDLETGVIAQKVQLGAGEIVGDVLTIDKNKDYVTERLYFGTAYDNSGTWNGRLLGLDIPNQDLSSGWTPAPDAIFEGAFPFTASPDAASDVSGNVWVYAGSGKYYSDVDEYAYGDQIFTGIKDQLGSVTYPVDVTTTGMDDKSSTQTTGTVTETEEICGYNDATDQFEQQTVVTKTDQTSGAQTTPDVGWYVLLPNGERVISRPLAVGGLVDYLTYLPSSDECSYGGESYLYAVGYTTGEAPNKIAIRNAQTTGGATSGEVDISRGIRLGPGAPPTGEAIIIPPPKEGQEQLKKKIQVATGVIVEAENTPAISVTSEMVHWLKK